MSGSKVSVAIVALVLVLATRQGKADVIDDCGAEKDNFARLACFDRAVAARHAEAADTHKAAEANTGLEGAQLRKALHAERVPAERPAPIVARITSVRQVSAEEFSFELDNGQVWRQIEDAAGLDVRPQDSIKITPGVLGSFFMTTAQQQTFRVKRIR